MRVDDSTGWVHLLVITTVRNIIRLWNYIDFARAKSEALDSLLKQNINRVMLSGKGTETVEKTTIGLMNKKA